MKNLGVQKIVHSLNVILFWFSGYVCIPCSASLDCPEALTGIVVQFVSRESHLPQLKTPAG